MDWIALGLPLMLYNKIKDSLSQNLNIETKPSLSKDIFNLSLSDHIVENIELNNDPANVIKYENKSITLLKKDVIPTEYQK